MTCQNVDLCVKLIILHELERKGKIYNSKNEATSQAACSNHGISSKQKSSSATLLIISTEKAAQSKAFMNTFVRT